MENAPKLLSKFIRFLDRATSPKKAHAHCDVPCGVYEPDSMLWAVETCKKLVEKLVALDVAPDQKDKAHYLEYHNIVTRAVITKEQYAGICKEQLLILWTDYFKPEHFAKYPDLHEKIWKATKQCSVVKRTVSIEEVAKLETMVKEIADAFRDSKK